jgi:hypothetical protein
MTTTTHSHKPWSDKGGHVRIDTDDPGAARYEEKQKRDAITHFAKRAHKLGFRLVEAVQSSPLESLVVSGVP